METPATPTAPEKKSAFALIVTSTPVMLAIVATFILGQSSSEMTKAQYQRSLAGQNQSKVANQWDFFQAKRIRGTTLEAASAVLSAQSIRPFTPTQLAEVAESLVVEIQATEKEMPNEMPLREPLLALAKRAEDALEQVKKVLNPPKDGITVDGVKLTPENVKLALDALSIYPKVSIDKTNGESEDKEQYALLNAILDDVRGFKHEEAQPKTIALKSTTIDNAMKRAKARAAEVSKRSKAIDIVLERIDGLVDTQVALQRDYERAVAPYLNSGDKTKGAKVEERILKARAGSGQLIANYKAVRFTFDAKRYEEDARFNQDTAYLCDVYALQSSARSDKHLTRSFGFMIAMLVAQVGVTIGTLALTMRWKVPAWLIALIAGLSAIALGVYVFLEMGPLDLTMTSTNSK